jgi:UDP-N-acetylmuramoylalanine--D-glutamate ligase
MTFDVHRKRVVVVGGGRSGRAATELLVSKGAQVVLSDTGQALDGADELRARGIEVELGPHRADRFAAADLIVVSPGVPFDQEALVAARAVGVPVIGEIELASRWLEC